MTFPVLDVLTGNIVFNYFFTLVMFSGLIAIVPGQIFKLFRL